MVEKNIWLGYNNYSDLGCATTSVVLNLHYFKRDSYISVICQASRYAGEGRKADADTHLAAARSQETETGISGYTKDKRTAAKPFFLYNKHETSCNFANVWVGF